LKVDWKEQEFFAEKMGKKNRLQKKKGGGDVIMRSDVPLDEQFTRSAAVTKQRKRKVKDHANSDDEDVDQVWNFAAIFSI
jgi:hypothetical protein